eukprot:3825417-Amphidinium_carterae.1
MSILLLFSVMLLLYSKYDHQCCGVFAGFDYLRLQAFVSHTHSQKSVQSTKNDSCRSPFIKAKYWSDSKDQINNSRYSCPSTPKN